MDIEIIDGALLNPDGSINENTVAKLEGAINATDGFSHLRGDSEWERKSWTFKKDITAALAYAAVRLSPYAFPDDLEKVIGYLDACLDKHFKTKIDMAELSLLDIKAMYRDYVLELPSVNKWNERKNGKEGNSVSCRYSSKPDPDDDFIDLGALIHNACLLIRDDRRAFKAFNDKFEKEHGKLSG